ncbi:alpha/beta hydrolase [Cohnella rhizosphaerae]|uniref:Alpha/beta hydrolase n=1 Tax=Cohnella rhizosphaerae TaxID=1457232 RepID=A0A9X4KYT4_9BACL|nr:alpha/beta hydrolase [Cohnella rhizosphaerae]MDG0813859.1 alpha/beta hydrolase [Cohnella rhizosphaerae]
MNIILDAAIQSDAVPETVVYEERQGVSLKMRVVKPEGWQAGDRRTALLWIHGGGWQGGSPDMFIPHARYFAVRGAVCFSVQYRLIGGADAPASSVRDCLADCRSALRFIRGHASTWGIDPERIAVIGDSAGGYLALAMQMVRDGDNDGNGEGSPDGIPDGRPSAYANAVIACNGIADLTQQWRKTAGLCDESEAQPAMEEAAVEAWLARYGEARRLSPIYNVREGVPPLLILHGLRDGTVAAEEAVRLYEAYKQVQSMTRLRLFADAKHAFILYNYTATVAQTEEALSEIDRFLSDLSFLPSIK